MGIEDITCPICKRVISPLELAPHGGCEYCEAQRDEGEINERRNDRYGDEGCR